MESSGAGHAGAVAGLRGFVAWREMNRAVQVKPMRATPMPNGMEKTKRCSTQSGEFCDPWGQPGEFLIATIKSPTVTRNPDARDTMNPQIPTVANCRQVGSGAVRIFTTCQINVINASSASALVRKSPRSREAIGAMNYLARWWMVMGVLGILRRMRASCCLTFISRSMSRDCS